VNPAIAIADVVAVLQARATTLASWAREWEGSPEVGELRHAQVTAQVAELQHMARVFEEARLDALALLAPVDA
jgi:hypothetical protein